MRNSALEIVKHDFSISTQMARVAHWRVRSHLLAGFSELDREERRRRWRRGGPTLLESARALFSRVVERDSRKKQHYKTATRRQMTPSDRVHLEAYSGRRRRRRSSVCIRQRPVADGSTPGR